MNFTDYAASKGLQLLKDDINYIQRQLKHIPKAERKQVMLTYIRLWKEAMAQEGNVRTNQNKGRYAANHWLLGFKGTGRKAARDL